MPRVQITGRTSAGRSDDILPEHVLPGPHLLGYLCTLSRRMQWNVRGLGERTMRHCSSASWSPITPISSSSHRRTCCSMEGIAELSASNLLAAIAQAKSSRSPACFSPWASATSARHAAQILARHYGTLETLVQGTERRLRYGSRHWSDNRGSTRRVPAGSGQSQAAGSSA